MTLPYSTRLTMPLTISPMRSLYSSILPLALGLAHLLHDHLLGVLRGDAAEIERRQGLGDEVADMRLRVAPARVLQRDLRGLLVTASTTSSRRASLISPVLGSISALISFSLP